MRIEEMCIVQLFEHLPETYYDDIFSCERLQPLKAYIDDVISHEDKEIQSEIDRVRDMVIYNHLKDKGRNPIL